MRVGADTGGTFTDLVDDTGQVTKVLSTPGAGSGPLPPARVRAPPAGAEAVAVCPLHADLDPAHERAVAMTLTAAGVDVTCSSELSPELREYERTVTTVINAYLRPACRAYLRSLADAADEVLVMTSAGGLLPAEEAAEIPAAVLLSGPAGGGGGGG